MKPVLFESSAQSYGTYGLGVLTDAANCIVEEERNGSFVLEMKYPVNGQHFEEIRQRRIIFAKPSPGRNAQPFRIYRISKPSNGVITVYAEHISYDLIGIPIAAFTATTAAQAMTKINSLSLISNPFTFSTDVVKNANFSSAVPAGIRSIMGGVEGSILDIYHGEWLYDLFTVQLKAARGADHGVKIRYGKNLTTLEQDENIAEMYTGVLPYWYSEEDGLAQGSVQYAPGTFDFTKIKTVDFTQEYEEKPTAAVLNAAGAKYIQNNDIGKPNVSLEVSFVDLSKASGYESLANLETVELCDTVTVEFEKLNISATAKVIKTTYDVLLDRYTSVEIGNAKDVITDTIAEQSKKLAEQNKALVEQNIRLGKTAKKTEMEEAIEHATKLITGNLGGYVILNDRSGDGYPDEILIMDTPNKNTAQKIWRWNLNGLGYSNTGYNGPYGLAMTMAGAIVANYITSGVMSADRISGGTIDATNINVTNINGENIRNKTIGNTAIKDLTIESGKIKDLAITEGKINTSAVTENKINTDAVTESKIKASSVSYGKTSYGVQSTLTQVGTNAADISQLWVEVDRISANLASFRTALASSVTTESLTINDPSFYYNGAKMTYVGFLDSNGDYHEVLGYY